MIAVVIVFYSPGILKAHPGWIEFHGDSGSRQVNRFILRGMNCRTAEYIIVAGEQFDICFPLSIRVPHAEIMVAVVVEGNGDPLNWAVAITISGKASHQCRLENDNILRT